MFVLCIYLFVCFICCFQIVFSFFQLYIVFVISFYFYIWFSCFSLFCLTVRHRLTQQGAKMLIMSYTCAFLLVSHCTGFLFSCRVGIYTQLGYETSRLSQERSDTSQKGHYQIGFLDSVSLHHTKLARLFGMSNYIFQIKNVVWARCGAAGTGHSKVPSTCLRGLHAHVLTRK